MKWRLAVLGGDGVGPEVTEASLEVLRATAERFGHELTADLKEVGFAAYEQFGTPLPEDTLAACRSADAVLLGAVGDPRSEGVPVELRPEAALLALRKEMGCYANLRPVRLLPALASASPLRPEIGQTTLTQIEMESQNSASAKNPNTSGKELFATVTVGRRIFAWQRFKCVYILAG